MAKNSSQNQIVPSYEPRWFIWTILFLVVTGVALVSYIQISSQNTQTDSIVVNHVKKAHK